MWSLRPELLTPGQIRLIHRLPITLCSTTAWPASKPHPWYWHAGRRMNIKVCLLPDGDDPDSFARKHNATRVSTVHQRTWNGLIRFKTNLLLEDASKDPIKRAELINNIVQKHLGNPGSHCTRRIYQRMRTTIARGRQTTRFEVAKRREIQAEKKTSQSHNQQCAFRMPADVSGEFPPPFLPDDEDPYVLYPAGRKEARIYRYERLVIQQ